MNYNWRYDLLTSTEGKYALNDPYYHKTVETTSRVPEYCIMSSYNNISDVFVHRLITGGMAF